MKGMKDVLILILIAILSGVALSGVYLGTRDKIAEAKLEELESALGTVMPFMKETYREVGFDHEGTSYPIYEVTENGEFLGAAIEMVSPEGYSGDITFLLGVNGDEAVTGIYILDHKETPGLGTKAEDEAWWGQFLDKTLESYTFKVKKDGGDVDAITAATITSRAISDYVGKGLAVFRQFKAERGDNE